MMVATFGLLIKSNMKRRHKRRWRVYIRTRSILKRVRRTGKREGKETRIAIKLLRKSLKKGDLSPEEKKFLKGQLKDLARILPLVAAQAVPLPIPITPALLIFGKKIGIDFIPKEQEMSDSMIKEEEERKKRKNKN